jgi:hypothetical protein
MCMCHDPIPRNSEAIWHHPVTGAFHCVGSRCDDADLSDMDLILVAASGDLGTAGGTFALSSAIRGRPPKLYISSSALEDMREEWR